MRLMLCMGLNHSSLQCSVIIGDGVVALYIKDEYHWDFLCSSFVLCMGLNHGSLLEQVPFMTASAAQ